MIDTQKTQKRRKPHDHEGDWSEAATSQGHLQPLEARKGEGQILSGRASGGSITLLTP